MKMSLNACIFVLTFFVFSSFLYAANDEDTLTINNQPSNALSVFGSRPDYSAGIKPTMIVDEFAAIDHSLTEIRKQQIKNQISMWRADGISYGAYYGFQNIESSLNDSVDKGEDLDGSTLSINPITRQDQQDYLINSGKLAIDLGSEYIFLDVAIIGFYDSFDEETIENFRVYLSENYSTPELTAMGVIDISSFDYAQYLRDEGYASIEELQNSTPNDLLWNAWEQYHLDFERYWFGKWGDTLRNYAQSEYNRNVYLGGNRYVYGGNKQWYVADLLDYTLAETFLDELGYPYHTLTFAYKTSMSLGKRFWSWNFPANTATLNGTGDVWNQTITKLDGLFAAETFANGGLAQVPMGWKQYLRDGQRVDVLIPFYRFALAHPELYNHEHKGDVAVIYSEPGESIDPGTQGRSFRGAVEMLDQMHITYDIIFTGGKNTIDTLTLASLSPYNTVILPNTRYLSDNQVSVLEQYLAQGGTLVGVGIIGDQNEEGEFVSRSFTEIFTDGVHTVNGGTVIASTDDLFYEHYMAYDSSEAGQTEASGYRTDFESLISGHVARDIFTSMPETIHLTRYIDSTDQSHIYHFVNYDYDMSTYDVNAVQDSTVSMVVPEGFDASSLVISLMSPENPAPEILTHSVDTGYATFTVSEINTWAIVKIGTSAEQAIIIDDAPQSMMNLDEFYGGHRPDEKNEDGDISYNYWYWKDHSPGQSDSIPYLATDDLELSKVELHYRFSADEISWTDWALTDSIILSDTSYINSAFYVKNLNGDGYYQYQTRAVDSSGQTEIGGFIDELGHGIDTTKPEAAEIAVEINGAQNNVSQSEISTPTFTWTMPEDNLSGTQWVNIEFRKIPSWEFVAGAYNISTDDTTYSPGELEYGNYILTMKGQDYAGNWADESTVFTFIYQPPSGDIEVAGNGIVITDNDYTPEIADDTDFGEMRYQGDNVIHTFTIKNVGNLDLNLTEAITISNTPIFSVTQPNKTLLEPSDSTQFQVICNPSSMGQYNANVSISSDDPDENPFTFEVFGRVIIPTLTITADNKSRDACAANPEFTITYDGFLGSDDESVFSILPVASCTADESSPAGEYDISLSEGHLDGYNLDYNTGTLTIYPDFTMPELTVTDSLNVYLNEYGTAEIKPEDVILSASDNCEINDTLLSRTTFTSDDFGYVAIDVSVVDINENSTTESVIVIVSGAPEIDVQGNGISIVNNDETPYVDDGTDFGDVLTGSDNFSHSFSIINTGIDVLQLIDLVELSDTSVFRVSQPDITNLPANTGTTNFEIICHPNIPGIHTTYLTIYNNDIDENPYTFMITVNITKPVLTVTAGNQTREACVQNPDFTVSYQGFIDTDDESVLTSQPETSSTADESSTLGEYEIVVTGGSSDTYDFSYVSGTLTITPDVTDPELSVIDTLTVTLDVNNQAIITATDVVENASDNCGIVDTSLSQSTFSVNDLGNVPIDVTVSDGNGNSTSSTTIIKVIQESTRVNNLTVDDIKIYPNPTTGLITLDFTDNMEKHIDIVNIIGNAILRISTDNKSEIIDLTAFDDGMYIIQVQTGQHTSIHLITKL